MKKNLLSVIIPVYNEEACIAPVTKKWLKMLDSLGISYCLHIYNDGSRDGTLKILQDLAVHYSDRLEIHDKVNSGHGPTILRGYQENCEKSEWVFQVDSDDEMSPDGFPELWNRRDNYDFLCGTRENRRQALPRRIISAVSRLTVRILYGKSIYDVNTPYRLMRTSAFQEIFHKIPSNTFAPNVLLSAMAAVGHLRCYETPVHQTDRTSGEVSLKKWKLFKAAVFSFYQSFAFSLEYGHGQRIFWSIAGLSVLLKLLMSLRGHNFDFESYEIVADIMEKGGCVYSDTVRYNYGPVWFYILFFLKSICGTYFRLGLVLLLSFCDIGIAGLLWRQRWKIGALIFLLSPICIYTTGLHNQFDNLAILIGLMAATFLTTAEKEKSLPQTVTAAFLLGLSLMTKHVFAFLPFWLFFQQKKWRNRLLLLLIPLIMFGASFLPYVASDLARPNFISSTLSFTKSMMKGNLEKATATRKAFLEERPKLHGVVRNVFFYPSFDNQILRQYFLPGFLRDILPGKLLFFGGMLLFGFWMRKKQPVELLLQYTGILLILSTAITNQYLEIPTAFAAVYAFPFGILYQLIGIPLCLFPYWEYHNPCNPYTAAVFLLILVFGGIYRHSIANLLENLAKKLNRG